ncbi:exodeoxyribonuclease VII small subunit [Rickettsiales bacterium LUAb2]
MAKISNEVAKLTFEEAYEKLKIITEQLQEENTSLEQTIVLYKEGKALSDHCNNLLQKAKLEIENITKPANERQKEE